MEELAKAPKTDVEKQQALAETNRQWKQRYDSLQVFSFQDAYPSADNPNVKALVKVRPNATKTLLFTIITDLCRSFNILNTMSAEQIMNCVQDLVFDFPDLTIRDYKLFSRMATGGSFGKSFNRIDKAVVYEWLNLYCDAQFKHVENEHINQKHKGFDLSKQEPELVQLLSEAVKGAKEAKEQQKSPIIREPSETDKIIQQWLKEFDEIFQKQTKGAVKVPPLRMIKVDGQKYPVDAMQYVALKLNDATI